ncbi:hypothetical protein [Desulforhopalus singaporensis]|uniref:Acyl-protein synthetase, LuxE n=1 Tax=Desulforhopalus singaporensis TaxID=91360 RepID=A0A1H0PTR5_9BACT|nr:hypothetical protein [Desulforhopalus singaporensis]SDP08557.1 hypothetical protein SAMN05660330_01763 [Desulforhopalus singaporensis]
MNNKITDILKLHFDRQDGTPYWLDRQRQLGFDVASEITDTAELYRLGPMDLQALRTRPITDFIPRCFHQSLSSMLLSETGGTTGDPCRRVYSQNEFHDAFVGPWLEAVEKCDFPHRGTWLFVGPGGPHIIDRSARAMARSVGSLEPFFVDCDVRWIKKQKKNSLGFTLYIDHVIHQAENVIGCQNVDTLFTTPPLLLFLGQRMSRQQRLRIKGIHTGGMALTSETRPALTEMFPNAVILPGYGNSLFGVTFPVSCDDPDTFRSGDQNRLMLRVAPFPEGPGEEQDIRNSVESGQRGRIVCNCFDETFLIVNLVERDTAVAVDIGNGCRGISAIETLDSVVAVSQQGVY